MNTFWKCYLIPRSAAFFIKSFLVRAIFTVHFSAECTAMERSPFSSTIKNPSILKPRPHLPSANEFKLLKYFLQFFLLFPLFLCSDHFVNDSLLQHIAGNASIGSH